MVVILSELGNPIRKPCDLSQICHFEHLLQCSLKSDSTLWWTSVPLDFWRGRPGWIQFRVLNSRLDFFVGHCERASAFEGF